MKKDFLSSIAVIEAAQQRSEGIAESAVQMLRKDLLLMLQKKVSKRLHPSLFGGTQNIDDEIKSK